MPSLLIYLFIYLIITAARNLSEAFEPFPRLPFRVSSFLMVGKNCKSDRNKSLATAVVDGVCI